MASVTKFYPCNTRAEYSPSTFKGSWTTAPSSTYLTLADDKTGAGLTLLSRSGTASSNKIGIRACVSNPLEAQTVTGNFDMAVNVQETNADSNFFTRVYMYVTQGDTDSVRGVLLDFADTGGTEWATTAFGVVYAFSAPQALTPVACTAGDRIVIEFGVQAVAGAAASRTAQMWWGSTNRFEDGTLYPDATVGASGTGVTVAGFFEFDTPVDVQRADAVEGDLLVGNRELWLYDGATGALKRRILPVGSSDPAGSAQIADDGTIYVSYESLNATDDEENGQIAMYDPVTLEYDGLFQVFPGVGPHSLAPSQAGALYAGFTGDGTSRASCGEATSGGPTPPVTPASAYIRQYDSVGNLDDTFNVGLEDGGSNAIDLFFDQSTMLYTSLGREILAYDIVNDVQLPVWGTLPAASAGEIARGLRILPDGSVLVVDKINIKRLVDGVVTQTYSVVDQDDWGTISLSPDGSEFWVANRADDSVVPPMIAKFEVESGDLLFTITGEENVPDTEGGMCSGGINVINGYRAALNDSPTGTIVVTKSTAQGDTTSFDFTTTGGLTPSTFSLQHGQTQTFEDVVAGLSYSISENPISGWQATGTTDRGTLSHIIVLEGETTTVSFINTPIAFPDFTLETEYPRRLIRSPHVSANGNYLRYKRLQLDMQPGMAEPPLGVPRDVMLRVSHDGGNTWSSFRTANPGAVGKYLARVQWWALGYGRDTVFEFVDHLPNTIVTG